MNTVRVWTWDYGRLKLSPKDSPKDLAWVISKLVNHGIWWEFRKIPPRWVRRALPYLNCPSYTKRFIRLYLQAH